jgi:hypothetical protein
MMMMMMMMMMMTTLNIIIKARNSEFENLDIAEKKYIFFLGSFFETPSPKIPKPKTLFLAT